MAKIGVVLATYNGEKYLSQMLDSLESQRRKPDFIIAVDDGSLDATVSILRSYQERLPLQITELGENRGHRAAFSKALHLANLLLSENDYVALADQDDIWLKDKLEILERELESSSASLVVGDAFLIDSKSKVFASSWRNHAGILESLSVENMLTGFTNVTGCMTLFKASLLSVILPIPEEVPVHDQWIAICAGVTSKYKSVSQPVIQYRIHENNAIGLKKKSWEETQRENLRWSKMLLNSKLFPLLDMKAQEFLKHYVSYVECRLTKSVLLPYFFWLMNNSKNLFPHKKGFLKIFPLLCYGILGAPLIKKFPSKK